MNTSLPLFGALVALWYFGVILGIVFVPSWLQRRRREAVTRQVALTEVLDGQIGPFVAPTVTKRIWGPWRVEVVVPTARWDAVGQILAVADDVFANAGGLPPRPYQLVLAGAGDVKQRKSGARTRQVAGRVAAGPAAA